MDYIKLEQSSSKIDHARIRKAFEQAIIYFGSTSAGKEASSPSQSLDHPHHSSLDLWLTYLDYLKQHHSLDFISVSRTHSRALHALQSDELKRFNTECAVKNFT